jgi:hypothetical protein
MDNRNNFGSSTGNFPIVSNLSSNSFFKQSFTRTNEFLQIPHESLQYSNQYLGESEWSDILRKVKENQNINCIDLMAVKIDENGLRSLGDIIIHSPNIKSLILQWNYLNENSAGFEYLCETLNKSNLVFLNLNNNKITNSLCYYISELIKNSRSIMSIDLRGNDIRNEGAKILLSSLMINNSIQELNLEGNKITDDSLKLISRQISKNKMNLQSTFKINQSENNKFNQQNISIEENKEPTFIQEQTSPVKFLEREKELVEEFKARYDVQLIVNAKLEKRIKELETLLTLERNKVEDAKEKFERELEEERNLRIKYEEQILVLKEEFMKLSIEKNKQQIDSDLKLSSINNELSSLNNENKLLRESVDRIQQTEEEKLISFKEDYENKIEDLNSIIENLQYENEKIKREMRDELKNSENLFEKKYKTLEESYRSVKLSKEESDRINLQLKREILDVKINAENKINEKEKKLIEEENRRYSNMVSTYEQKIKVLESYNEDISQKIEKSNEEIQNLKKSSIDDQIQYENKINELNLEKLNLSKTITLLTSEQNKFSIELKSKNAMVNKLQTQIGDLNKALDDSLNNSNANLSLVETERKGSKAKIEAELKSKQNLIEELEKTVLGLKQKLAFYQGEDLKFSESIKSSIFKIIDNY